MMNGTVDTALWRVAPRFGGAGGPMAHELTEAGLARAFAAGAKVREGDAARALETLASLGGTAAIETRRGARLELTELGRRFTALAWGTLRALGYVETIYADATTGQGVRLTEAGRVAVENGQAERARLLARIRAAHPLEDS